METSPVPPSSRARTLVLIAMTLLCIALISWAGNFHTNESEAEPAPPEKAAPVAAGMFSLAGQE